MSNTEYIWHILLKWSNFVRRHTHSRNKNESICGKVPYCIDFLNRVNITYILHTNDLHKLCHVKIFSEKHTINAMDFFYKVCLVRLVLSYMNNCICVFTFLFLRMRESTI